MIKKALKYGIAAAVTATMIVFPAYGEMERPSAADFIKHFDKDGDGQVSAEEFPGDDTHFNQLDKDADGYISEAEAPQGPPPGPPGGKGGFERDDVDKDGRVSQAEFSGPEDLFERLDADGDGYISEEEAKPRHQGER